MIRITTTISLLTAVVGCDQPTRAGYECSYTVGEMTVNWGAAFNGQFVEYVAEVPSEYGWMAVGFNELPYMQGTTTVIDTGDEIKSYSLIDKNPSVIKSTASSPEWLADIDLATENGMRVLSFRRYLEFPCNELPDEWIILGYSETQRDLSQHSSNSKGSFLVKYSSVLSNAFSQLDIKNLPEHGPEYSIEEENGIQQTSISYIVSDVTISSFLSAAESFNAEINIELSSDSEIKCIQVCKVTRTSTESEWKDGECYGCEEPNTEKEEPSSLNIGYKMEANGKSILDGSTVSEAGWKSAAYVGGVFEDSTITVEISYKRTNYHFFIAVSLILILGIAYLTLVAKDSDFGDETDSDSGDSSDDDVPLKTVTVPDCKYLSDDSVDNETDQ